MGVTLEDVARQAGVSKSLVSLALKGSTRVAETSRKRVLAAAAELGYRPNLNARRLASGRTEAIGVLISDMHNTLFAEILDGFDERRGDHREQVLLASGFGDPRRERAAVDSFLTLQVDAVALLGSHLPAPEIQELARTIPTVVAGRRVRGVDSVVVDDSVGVRLVVEHLISLGHRSIAHLDGGQGPQAGSRRRTYTDTMRAHGLDDHIAVYRGDYTEKSGQAGFEHIWTNAPPTATPPTAVFAANDLSAVGILTQARSSGVTIPADLSVAGFDNTTLASSLSLTTVGYSGSEMGALTAELLQTRKEAPNGKSQTIVLPPTLVARLTTSEPRHWTNGS